MTMGLGGTCVITRDGDNAQRVSFPEGRFGSHPTVNNILLGICHLCDAKCIYQPTT